MQTKNVPFEEIYDILAVRIVFEPQEDILRKQPAGISTQPLQIFICLNLTGCETG